MRRLLQLLHSADCPPEDLQVELNTQLIIIPTLVIAIDKRWFYNEDEAKYGETNVEDVKDAKRLLLMAWHEKDQEQDEVEF